MSFSAPTQVAFLISLILAIVGTFVAFPVVTAKAFWVASAGYVALMLGCLLKAVLAGQQHRAR